MSTFTIRFAQRTGAAGAVDHIPYSGFKRMGSLKPITVRLPVTTIAKLQLLAEQAPEAWESQQEMVFEMIESAIADWIAEQSNPAIGKTFQAVATRALQLRSVERDEDEPVRAARKRSWKVEVRGIVSHLQGRGRVAAPLGEYRMEEVGLGRYRLSGKNKPTFELSILEVSTYLNEGHLRVEGAFPGAIPAK